LLLSIGTSARSQICAALLVTLAMSTGTAPIAWSYKTGNYSWAVAVSHDGRYVIAGSDDMRTYFFDAGSVDGKPLWVHDASGYVRHVAISRDGTYAAAGDTSGSIFFFRSRVLGETASVFVTGYSIDALVMSDDGGYLVGGDRRGMIYVFRTDEMDFPLWQYAIPGSVMALSLSHSGVLAATSSHGGLYFFGEVAIQSGYIWIFRNQTSFPFVSVSQDGSYIVVGGSDGYVYLLNRSGEQAGRQRIGGAVSALSLSSTEHRAVAGSTNGNLSIYEVKGGLVVVKSVATHGPVTSAVISDNGERVSVANLDGTISLFERSLEGPLWTFNAGAIVHSISMSDSGLAIAAASDTGSIHLFSEEKSKTADDTMPTIALFSAASATLLLSYLVWRRRRQR